MHRRTDYAYELPAERIAQAPADRRDQARLLCVGNESIDHRVFADLPQLLPAGAVLVINDTQVVRARLYGDRPTGGRVELLLCAPIDGNDKRWSCLARSGKPLRKNDTIALASATATIVEPRRADGTLEVELDESGYELMARAGQLPLPPYIQRPVGPGKGDDERYQTVYAKTPGAVAAPTAGLHVSEALLADLRMRDHIDVATVTLHVGPGTFQPVRVDNLDEHAMHGERYFVPEATAALCQSGRPVVALGTTVVRALEAAARTGWERVAGTWQTTDLFIRPGFEFRATSHLITNFHLPESTLLMLVCAFGGFERVLEAYRAAIAASYRFYSYGDAMFLSKARP